MHRRVATLALAGSATLLLAGCEKPLPAVTFFSGQDSTRIVTECWNEESAPARCDIPTSGAGSLTIEPGETVGISVDAEVADNGWVPAVGNRALVGEPIKESYYKVTLNQEQLDAGTLQVFATSGSEGGFRGVWVLDVERD
jgi:hypothetical protein